jgi:putative transposase
MKTLRRYNIENADYFITCVAFNRAPILLTDTTLFWLALKDVQPTAWVILPDHFHMVINCGKQGISDVMHHFKIAYSRAYRDRFGPGRLWQNRFWDHMIRDTNDLKRHMDYIHYNPVKQGLTNNPFEYGYSSLRAFYEHGFYTRDWMVGVDFGDHDFGE